MTSPAVSVVTIFLDAEEFLRESIESVLAQRFDSWELLLVDDGSTDRSAEIARWYAARFPAKVKVLEHPGRANRGMSASRNLALSQAQGEFVSLLDSDDVWFPWTLNEQVDALRSHPPAALACGASQYWHSWSGDRAASALDFVDVPARSGNRLFEAPDLLVSLLRGRFPVLCTCSVILRRDRLTEVGGFVDSFTSLYEEQACFAKLLAKYPALSVASCWSRYRQHARSSCADARNRGTDRSARSAYLQWLERYFVDQRIDHPELKLALDAARSPFNLRPSRMLRSVDVALQRTLPRRFYGRLKRWYRRRWKGLRATPLSPTPFRTLRRVTPQSRDSGVARYYIDRFLADHAKDVRGHVLEIRDDTYTRRFGGPRVTRSDVMVADLKSADSVPSDRFDCIICPQTLLMIYDVREALRTFHRLLRPGGVLLVTVPGVSHPISRPDMDRWGDFWRFTTRSARRLFEEVFPPGNVHVEARGNVLSAVAFLHGLAAEEFLPEELDHRDPDYEVSISVRAIKPTL